MSMSRKHYNAMVAARAETLAILERNGYSTVEAKRTFRLFANELSFFLRRDNPSFKAEKFREAMGCVDRDGKFPEER